MRYVFNTPEVIPEEKLDIPESMRLNKEVRDKILEEDKELRAKDKARHKMANFRIEVQFGSIRSTVNPTPVKIRVWESAKNLYGDGDVSMTWCGNENCLKPFSARDLPEVVVCPHCYRRYTPEQLASELLFKKPVEETILLVSQLFYYLKADADIVVRWINFDVRNLNKPNTHWDDWKEVELKKWSQVVYPYWRILDDTMAGQSLAIRLKDLMG